MTADTITVTRPRQLRRRLVAAAVSAAAALGGIPSAIAADPDLSEVAPRCRGGSSNPTFYASNHRVAVSSGGRVFAVYDPHGSGQKLEYRDAGTSTWRNDTRGATDNGELLAPGDTSNDRPASIVVGRDSGGVEQAWVVYSGYAPSKPSALKLRRLSDLDDPSGPVVGPEVNLVPTGRGNFRADIALEEAPSGRRAVLTWLQRVGDTQYQLMAGRLSSLDTDTPSLVETTALFTGSNRHVTGTLVPTAAGMRIVARTTRLRVFAHDPAESLDVWTQGSATVRFPAKARPAAVALGSGDILAVAESDLSPHIVKVVRFSSSGTSATIELTTNAGYLQPNIVHTSGDDALVVMVDQAADAIVSRTLAAGSWGPDVTEVASSAGGDYAWPNVLREPVDGYLRVLIDGPKCATSNLQNAVLAYSRLL